MSGVCAPFAVTVIIEWENAARIGNERAGKMLEALHEQIGHASPMHVESVELIVVYPREAGADQIRTVIANVAEGAPWRAQIRYAPAPCSGYYELKNHGAELAKGELIVLLDSDVIPQDKWFERIVAAFEDPAAMVVCGATWTDYDSLYSSAMALGWIFPLRPENETIVPISSFQANNVAFRRRLRGTMFFPPTTQYRGQGVVVIERLRAEGQTILMHRGAQVAHPPPAGIKGFITRALWSGYDLSVGSRRFERRRLWRGIQNLAGTGAASIFCVATRFRKVGLGVVGASAAALILGTYHGLRATAFVIALIAPRTLHSALTRVAP